MAISMAMETTTATAKATAIKIDIVRTMAMEMAMEMAMVTRRRSHSPIGISSLEVTADNGRTVLLTPNAITLIMKRPNSSDMM